MSNYKAAVVSLSVMAVALVIGFGVAVFTLEQKKSEKLSNWSNEKILAELGEPGGSVDCTALGLPQGMAGTGYIDTEKGRFMILCVVPKQTLPTSPATATG